MRILIAEDDAISQRVLQSMLESWGWEVLVTGNGQDAWKQLAAPDAPRLAVLDWMMPVMDGVEVCRRVRTLTRTTPTWLILLTGRGRKEDIVAGLEAGADDYLTKPFDREELHARLRVGERIIGLQTELSDRVRQLEAAMSNVKLLQGLLPICSYCKRVRDDQNYWQQVESYVAEHSEARFSHGVCPDCFEKVLKPELDQIRRERLTTRRD
jgi:CheY-like chemotaxis protein